MCLSSQFEFFSLTLSRCLLNILVIYYLKLRCYLLLYMLIIWIRSYLFFLLLLLIILTILFILFLHDLLVYRYPKVIFIFSIFNSLHDSLLLLLNINLIVLTTIWTFLLYPFTLFLYRLLLLHLLRRWWQLLLHFLIKSL